MNLQDSPDHLYIILECNLDSWKGTFYSLGDNIDALATLIAAHNLENNDNEVTILLAGPETSHLIYSTTHGNSVIRSRLPTTSYNATQIKEHVLNCIKLILSKLPDECAIDSSTHVTSALMQCVCLINKIKIKRSNLNSKILIISAKEPSSSEISDVINTEFGCKSLNTPISVCFNGSASYTHCPQFEHICSFTGGSLVEIGEESGDSLKGRYLLSFGQSSWTSQYMKTSTIKTSLTANAKCMRQNCKRCNPNKNISSSQQAYVCSVCLSVFCSVSERCDVCGVTWK